MRLDKLTLQEFIDIYICHKQPQLFINPHEPPPFRFFEPSFVYAGVDRLAKVINAYNQLGPAR